MSEYNKTILTNQGLDLMARANKGTARFAITRAATSTEQLANKSMADLQQLTELPSLMQYGVINNVADSTQDKSIVIGTELLFNNKDLGNGYNINTIGLFAKEDGQDKEILYAITTAIAPEFMPYYKNKVLFKFSLTMFVAVGRTDNVSVIVDDSNSATKADLTKVKKELDGKVNVGDVYSKTEVNEKLDQAGKLKKISVNGDTPVEPDDKGVANILVPQPDLSGLAQKTDLGSLYGMTTSGVKQSFSKVTVTPDTITDTGVYRLSACSITAQVDGKPLTPRQWGWLIVLNYNDAADTNGLYQFLVINEKLSKRVISLQQQTYPDFKTIADSDDLKPLTESIASKAGAVNGVKPDGSGNVSVPTYAANLLKGTSEQTRDIPPNTSTDVIHLMTDANTKYTVAVDLDYSAFTSGYAGCKLQVNNGGTVIVSPIITAGSKGRVSVTFTTPADCSWVAFLLTSNSSYTGRYSCMKASQWKDNDTPPDMTWVPAIEDYRADYAALSEKNDVGDDIEAIGRKLADKADASDVYSKSEADSKFGGAIKSIDGYYPDSQGRYYLANTYETINNASIKLKKKLSNLSNPDYSYTGTTLDVDNIANPGVYFFEKTKLSSSMNSHTFDDVLSLPYNCGYLIVDDCYFISTRCQAQFLLNFNLNNPAISIYVRLIMPGAGAYGTKFKAIVS